MKTFKVGDLVKCRYPDNAGCLIGMIVSIHKNPPRPIPVKRPKEITVSIDEYEYFNESDYRYELIRENYKQTIEQERQDRRHHDAWAAFLKTPDLQYKVLIGESNYYFDPMDIEPLNPDSTL